MVSCRFSRCMPPAKWMACVRRMASRRYAAGEIIFAPGSTATTLVRLLCLSNGCRDAIAEAVCGGAGG
jgi:hypothetical protein